MTALLRARQLFTGLALAAVAVSVSGCGASAEELIAEQQAADLAAAHQAKLDNKQDDQFIYLVGPDSLYGAGHAARDEVVGLGRAICTDYLGVGVSVAGTVRAGEPGTSAAETDLRNFVVAAHAVYCPGEDLEFT